MYDNSLERVLHPLCIHLFTVAKWNGLVLGVFMKGKNIDSLQPRRSQRELARITFDVL